jgi:2-methylisocitrate lyase-like PEP mutase family enzyme
MNMPVAARPWAIVRRTSEISEMTELMSFKQKLQQKRAILVPSAPNALTACVITDLGFEAIYVTGEPG